MYKMLLYSKFKEVYTEFYCCERAKEFVRIENLRNSIGEPDLRAQRLAREVYDRQTKKDFEAITFSIAREEARKEKDEERQREVYKRYEANFYSLRGLFDKYLEERLSVYIEEERQIYREERTFDIKPEKKEDEAKLTLPEK